FARVDRAVAAVRRAAVGDGSLKLLGAETVDAFAPEPPDVVDVLAEPDAAVREELSFDERAIDDAAAVRELEPGHAGSRREPVCRCDPACAARTVASDARAALGREVVAQQHERSGMRFDGGAAAQLEA